MNERDWTDGLSVAAEDSERLRLHNLSPLKGSRKKKTRKGRGYGAGQGGTCGFGMRGQNARSGPGSRPGFEGGQTPMYRRFPKLKGIAGGMGAGVPKYVTVNVDTIAEALASSKLDAGSEVTLASLKSAGIIKATGHYRNLPLKVLGDGELGAGVTVKAVAFSESAKAKIEAGETRGNGTPLSSYARDLSTPARRLVFCFSSLSPPPCPTYSSSHVYEL